MTTLALTRTEFEEGCHRFLSKQVARVDLVPEEQEDDRTTKLLLAYNDPSRWRWQSSDYGDYARLGYLISDEFDRVIFNDLRRNQDSDRVKTDGDEDRMVVTEVEEETMEEEKMRVIPGMMVRVRYHVVYSDSYRVPQLLIEAFKPDGVGLTLDELLNSNIFLSSSSKLEKYPFNTLQNSLPFLTQISHPINHIPVWSIHPCNTPIILEELMMTDHDQRGSQQSSPEPITCFFTLVSGLVDLRR